VSTLAHVFEAQGLATIALGSMRAAIEQTAPPRGLFCDFPLGRPLGIPGDAEFQHEVLAAALGLLDATEPIFAQYPISIEEDPSEAIACALPPRHDPGAHPAVDEARGLRNAYDRGAVKTGTRNGVGRVLSADDIPAAIEAFVRVAEGVPWKEAGIPGIPSRVSQDIRGYYETAALALIDHAPSAWTGTRWFLDETEAGKTILAARTAMRDAGAKHALWFYMTPADR
jgi:hypothetical protein